MTYALVMVASDPGQNRKHDRKPRSRHPWTHLRRQPWSPAGAGPDLGRDLGAAASEAEKAYRPPDDPKSGSRLRSIVFRAVSEGNRSHDPWWYIPEGGSYHQAKLAPPYSATAAGKGDGAGGSRTVSVTGTERAGMARRGGRGMKSDGRRCSGAQPAR